MQKIFILVFIALITRPVLAQKHYMPLEGQQLIDSLLRELKIAREDSGKVLLLNTISDEYKVNSPNDGVAYGKQGLELAEKINWKKGMAMAYTNIGLNYEAISDHQHALDNFLNASTIYQEMGQQGKMAVVYGYIGYVYSRQNRYPLAIEYNLKAIKILEVTGDKEWMATDLRLIGLIYFRQNDFNKAEEYYMKARAIYEELGIKPEMAHTLGNLGEVYKAKNDFDKALQYDTKALSMFEELGNKTGIATNLGNIAEIYKMQGRYDSSLAYSFRALGISKDMGDKMGAGIYTGNIGEAYLSVAKDTSGKTKPSELISSAKKENLQKAVKYLSEGIEMTRSVNLLDATMEFSHNLAESYMMMGDYKNALAYTNLYQELRDSIFSIQNTSNINNQEKKYQLELKQKDLDMANLTIEKKKNERVFYFIGIGLLIAVIIFISRNYNTQRKLNATISKLVNEQEKTIEQRTEALYNSNKKLQETIQFNAHNVREPATRIMYIISIYDDVPKDEFYETFWPGLIKAVNELDDRIKEVIYRAQDPEA